MKKIRGFVFIILSLLVFAKLGCNDVSNVSGPAFSQGIKSVIPAEGPLGARILIGGKGFGSVQKVLFNGVEAPIELSTDTTILTRVPEEATSGPITVVSEGETLEGPSFSVDSSTNLFLKIDDVRPSKAHHRDTVRIAGTGFNMRPDKNYVYFNKMLASVTSATDTSLITTVPDKAHTGLIMIVADQDTAIGPKFRIIRHEISGISPQSGLIGTNVTISGSNFSDTLSENSVFFNGVKAEVKSGSSTKLETVVPQKAKTGSVEVAVRQDTVEGPVFTVLSLNISSLKPVSGKVGKEVTISGRGFSEKASENTVTFNGTKAEVQKASPDELITTVPAGATSGPVKVSVSGKTAEGPNFVVNQPKSLQVVVKTEGANLDDDGYTLGVTGQDDRAVKPDDKVQYENIFESPVDISLSGIAKNCSVEGENPRSVELSSDEQITTTFNIKCVADAPIIDSVSPQTGPVGTGVVIKGANFSETVLENTVAFNGTEAEIKSVSKTELVTDVPEGATSGPIEVRVYGKTAEGPEFTVQQPKSLQIIVETEGKQKDDGYLLSVTGRDARKVNSTDEVTFKDILANKVDAELTGIAENCSVEGENPRTITLSAKELNTSKFTVQCVSTAPVIKSITPESGTVGTSVTITGMNFGSTPAANTVSFNGTRAEVEKGSEQQLEVTVPDGATTGAVTLTVDGQKASGPTFTVITSGALQVQTSTDGSSLDSDGYTLVLDSEQKSEIGINDKEVFEDLIEGSHTVKLTGIVSNCSILDDKPNPRSVNIAAGKTTAEQFNISCREPNKSPVASFKYECKNLSCKFDGSGSSDPDGSITSYNWTFGGKQKDTGETVSHSYETAGSFSVKLTVTDDEGLSSSTSQDIQITLPKISAISPQSGPVGTEVTISGSAFSSTALDNEVTFTSGSTEVAAEIKSASENELVVDVPGDATTGPVYVATYGYKVQGSSFTVERPKSLKIVVETQGEQLDEDGYTLAVSGRDNRVVKSNDDVTYSDLFADHVQAELSGVADNCSVDGENPRKVSLVANEVVTTTFTINCESTAPEITGISPESGLIGDMVTISGDNFGNTPGDNEVRFNGIQANLETVSPTELNAIVPDGATSGPVTVTANGQQAEGPDFTVITNGTLEITTSTSGSSLDQNGYSVSLDGGDGTPIKVNDTINMDGIKGGKHKVLLSDIVSNCSITDDKPNPRTVDIEAGETTAEQFNISCSELNQPPQASFTYECENLSCSFDGSGSSDSDGSIAGYAWDYGEYGSGSGTTVEHHYEVPGTYTVELTVTDDDGATATKSQEVTVTNPKISGISPESGPVGTEVTISGSGFSSTASDNEVTFTSGSTEVAAEIKSAFENELVVDVPGDATTGPVYVATHGYKVQGPSFTVERPKTLRIVVETEGTQLDQDGYTIAAEGQSDKIVKPNDQVQYNGLYADEIGVTLSGAASNCRVEGDNPRDVSLVSNETVTTTFTVDCTTDLRGKIIFQTNRDDNADIYYQNGSNPGTQIRITKTAGVNELTPALSPKGLRIAFAAYGKTGGQIYIMDADGSDVQQLTKDGLNSEPDWSPDGSKIVFSKDSGTEITDLFIMNSDGSKMQNLTNTSSYSEHNPDWSPDGKQILYHSDKDGDQELYAVGADGANEQQLTKNDVVDIEPEWSPTGNRIAFVRYVDGTGLKIHIMNADGSGAYELTPSSFNERSPSWSPNGSKVSYARDIEGAFQISIYSVEYNDILGTKYTPYDDENPHWNY